MVPIAATVHATNSQQVTITPSVTQLQNDTNSGLVSFKVSNPASNAYAITSITFIAPSPFNFTYGPGMPTFDPCPSGISNLYPAENTAGSPSTYPMQAFTCSAGTGESGIRPGYSVTIGNAEGVWIQSPIVTGTTPLVATFTTSITDASSNAAYPGPSIKLSVSAADSVHVSGAGSGNFIAGSSPITMHVFLGSKMSGVTVHLSVYATSGYGPGTVYSLPSSVTTGANGSAAFTFTPSNVAGDAAEINASVIYPGEGNTCCSGSFYPTSIHVTGYSGVITTQSGAPSKVSLSLSSNPFPDNVNITASNHSGQPSGVAAYFDMSTTGYTLSDAFGNAVSPTGLTFSSGTLSGGTFWNNKTTTTQITIPGANLTTAGISGTFGATPFTGVKSYEQSSAYGATGSFRLTLVGTYNSAGFAVSGTANFTTSLFSTNQVSTEFSLPGVSANPTVGSTITVQYSLTQAQANVPVNIVASPSANVSSTFTNGRWVGGATAYALPSLANVTKLTSSKGVATASFVLPTEQGITETFSGSITYNTNTTTYTAVQSAVSNSTTTAAGKVSAFTVTAYFDHGATTSTTKSVAGQTLYIVVYLTDVYGNTATATHAQIQIGLTASTGQSTLSATSIYIATGSYSSNNSTSFGVVSWTIPATATGTVTVSASGLYTTGIASVAIVSANPTAAVTSVNGMAYTSGTAYSHTSSVSVSGTATVSAGVYPAPSIAAVNASVNGGASASFMASSPWTFVNSSPLKVGSNTISFTSTDSLGSVSSATSLTVVYDPAGPTITFPKAPITVASGGVLSVTITTLAGDLNTSSIAVTVNGTAITSWTLSGSTLSITGLSAGHKGVVVSASTLAGLTTTSPSTLVTVSLQSGSTFTSTGATSSTSGGFTGASATFTNNAASGETVNVYFVWYNAKTQVVSVGAQLNVAFTSGQSQTFFNSYQTPGTYTVKVFIQDATGNALSSSYSTTVTIA